MAQIPGVFNAAQYFGNSSPRKDHQGSFWDQQSNSENHSSGSAQYQHPFEGNSTTATDPFMTSVQNEFDGWDEWPPEDDFYGNDSFHQNHVGPYDLGSTPNHNTGYNDSQLVVPDHGNFQEDLSESSNSSSVESSPRGMDPELNNTWVEEETTPYSFSKYPPAVVSSSQSMTPQTATLQSSEADFFDHYFNGQTNTEHTNVEEQSSTSNGPTYASVCQAGMPAAPYQGHAQNLYFNQQQSHVAPSSQVAGTSGLFDPQDNGLDDETWSREPELGSWPPVFNHEEMRDQQHMPESFEPEAVQGDPCTGQSGQRENHPEAAQESHQNFLNDFLTQAPGAFPVTKAEGDVMLHHSDIEPSLQESVQADRFLVQKEGIPASNLNFFDEQQQATMGGMSEHHGNLQPGAFPASPTEGDIMLHSSDLEPPSQEQYEAVPQSMVPPGLQPNIMQSIVEQPETVQNMAFSKGNIELHPDSDLDHTPSVMLPGVPPTIPHAPAENSEPLQVVPPHVPTSIQQASVQHSEPLQDMALSNNDVVLHHSDLEPPVSMVPPSVPASTQSASFQKPEPVQASFVPQGDPPSIPQACVQQSEPPQDMALIDSDIRLRGSDVETAPNMVPPGVSQASVQQPEPAQGMTLPERDLELPPKMVPPGVPTFIPQASLQQPDPVQSMAENISANPDHNAYVKLPSNEKPLADSLDHNLSMDSPLGTFKPSSVVEPVQPPSLGKEPSERSLLELFKPAPVEQMQLHMPPKMEGQFQPSGKQESTVDEPDSPRDAIQAAYLQKQLAGKAPASSPRTSLWLNSVPLSAPCVLAPAAVTAVESSEYHGNDQASPADRMDIFTPLPYATSSATQENLSRQLPAASRTPALMTATQQELPKSLQMAPFQPPQGQDIPYATSSATQENLSRQLPAASTTPALMTARQQELPKSLQVAPFPPPQGQDIPYATSPAIQENISRELPAASTTPALISAAQPELPRSWQMEPFQSTQGQDIPYATSSAVQENISRELPAASTTPASISATQPELPKSWQMEPFQPTQGQDIFTASPHATSSATQENILRELPTASMTPALMSATQQELPKSLQMKPFQPTQGQDIFTPSPHATASATKENILRELPAVSTTPSSMPAPQQELLQPVQPVPFEPTQGQDIYAPSPSTHVSASVEKKRELPGASTAPAPVQMSLASLLQGGKARPKKKTSETSKMDVAPSQDVNVPSQETSPPNPFAPQSGLPSIPLSSSAQESSRNSEQQLNNESFGSSDRTDQQYIPPNESDYHDPYSRENSRSRDDSYYEYNRRDPYYDQDRRENDRRDYDRRDYERREHERHDYDRHNYDRRDRGEFDRREGDYRRDSDYSRRDYDSREYDRRDFGRRDYERRDSYHDRRDPYYGYGSPRQSRRGYNEGHSSREDLYRAPDPGYTHSYHSGRSTPSSDYERNNPAYDYSSPSYASHQYGYPSYADSQSMDMYQYLTMLYYYYPQHYEQYCAQQGYYNMGYTPEQLAQFYSGIPYPPGYESSQPEQAAEAVVQESEPARLTPPLYRVQHPLVQFTGGGRLISLMSSEDEEEQPKCVIASVQMVFSAEEMEIIKAFPGPLSSMYSSRTEVISYCELRSTIKDMSADGMVKSLIWKILANLVKHNGAFVASDLAELIMENWRSCNTSNQNEFLSAESGPPSSEYEMSKHLSVFREMLLAGATKDALEYTMRYRLWGHAMVLASKMDKKVQNEVTNRFMKTMTDFDPIRTVYDHLSGRQPVALMTPDDWQRNLAAMVANPPRQHPQSNKRNMICLADTLMANDHVWAAHLCYTLAGEKFGFPSDEKTKMALIGIDHRKKTISYQHIPLENLQMMEVLEYAVSLNSEDHYIPVLQTYKYLHANKLAEAGFTDEALHYADLTGKILIKHPHHFNSTLIKNMKELTDRLNPDGQDAAVAETTEMLDRLVQAKDSSQISSSVTESEGDVEDPLAESSASFFSGYDPVNTPKHQVEKTEEVQRQESWSEPTSSAPAVSQESMADLRQDSWSGSMDTRVAQPDLPPAQQLPPSTGPQLSSPRKEPPPPVDPPPQPPFFVPGPPVSQELPGHMESEQPAAVEEQPFYNQQPTWSDIQQPPWSNSQQPPWNDSQQPPWTDSQQPPRNKSQQSSWSEGAGYEDSKKVEPPPAKEPEPLGKEEPKPKPSEKAKKKANNGSQGGWFSGLSGIIQKVIPRGPNEMILPDDTKKSIYWDEDLKKWVNTDEDEEEKAPPPPPPSDMQLSGGMPPPMPPPMPLGHGIPPNGGAAVKGVGGRAGSPPFSPTLMPNVPGRPTLPGNPQSSPGIPTGMATPPVASKFSRKAHGGSRHAKKYVDVLNPSGKSSTPAMLPSSLLPMMPMPGPEFKGNFFVPSPVNTDTSDERADEQTLDQSPAIGNPSSRPSSRNEVEDGGDEQSQHSRSSSVSLASAEVRSYMMPQDPDPPPQDMNAAPPPMFFDPMAFSQPPAQASPRKSRYPGIRK